MASIALSVVGTAIGGPLGGAIGSALGSMIDGVLFPTPKQPLPPVTSSTYGNAIPRAWGPNVGLGCNMIWTSGFRKESAKSAAGASKNAKGTPQYVTDFAMAVMKGPVRPSWLVKLWANGTLIFDATAAQSVPIPDAQGVVTWTLANVSHQCFDSVVVYPGNGIQLPDPTIESDRGVGNTPAYLGRAYFVMNGFNATLFGNGIPVFRALVKPHASITLAEVVLDITNAAGIDPNTISTSGLSNTVEGYAITSQSDGVAALAPLSLCYDFDVAEVSGNLRCMPRGQQPICTITDSQLAGHAYGEDQPDARDWPRAPETTLPKLAALTFNDPNRDLNQNTQSSKRDGGSASSNISTSVQLTLTSDQAKKITDRMLWEAQVGRQAFNGQTDDRLIFIESARTYAIQSPAGYESVRITTRARGVNGVIEFSGKRDYSALYLSTAPGASANPAANVLLIGGPVNAPVFIEPPRSFPNVTAATLLIGVSGGDGTTANPAWRGCTAYVSTDDENYLQIGTISEPACMGVLTADLAASGGQPDIINTLSVSTLESSGDPAPMSPDDAKDGQIPYFIAGSGRSGEFLSAETVTDNGGFQFDLKRLYRGQWATSGGAHLAGAALVRIDQALFRYQMPLVYLDSRTLYFRFVGAGETLASVTTYSYVPNGSGYGTADGGLPQAPSSIAFTPSPSGNVVSFDAPDPDDNVTSTTILRADGDGADFADATPIGTAGAGATVYTDPTATVGSDYTYFAVHNNAVGAGDNSAGASDTTQGPMPTGSAIASEALTAGNVCQLYDAAGVATVRKANATDLTKPANCFVLAGTAMGATATIFLPGQWITGLSGLTKGAQYWLDTTGGGITTSPPSTSGNGDQIVGWADDTGTKLFFMPQLILGA